MLFWRKDAAWPAPGRLARAARILEWAVQFTGATVLTTRQRGGKMLDQCWCCAKPLSARETCECGRAICSCGACQAPATFDRREERWIAEASPCPTQVRRIDRNVRTPFRYEERRYRFLANHHLIPRRKPNIPQ